MRSRSRAENGRRAASDGARRTRDAQKISPGEPEDLPELSAGSSESEDLPDPTRGKLSARPPGPSMVAAMREKPHRAAFTSAANYWRRRAGGEHPFARVGLLGCARRIRPGRRARRHASRLRAAGRAGCARARRSSGRSRRASTSSPRPAPARGRASRYLIPALESGQRVVVATATKALQEQLLAQDVPAAAARARPRGARRRAQGPPELPLPQAAPELRADAAARAARRGGVRGAAAVARGDRDGRPRRAAARAVGRALGGARGRRRPLRGAAAARFSRPASPRRRARGRARPSS